MGGCIDLRVIDQVILPAGRVTPGAMVVPNLEAAFVQRTSFDRGHLNTGIGLVILSSDLCPYVFPGKFTQVYWNFLRSGCQPVVNKAVLKIIVE